MAEENMPKRKRERERERGKDQIPPSSRRAVGFLQRSTIHVQPIDPPTPNIA